METEFELVISRRKKNEHKSYVGDADFTTYEVLRVAVSEQQFNAIRKAVVEVL